MFTKLGYICAIFKNIKMKNKHLLLLVVITLCFVTLSNAQRQRSKGTVDIKNGFAIGGGITHYDIITDDFQFINKNGWIFGMSATVGLPHKGYNVSYGMQLSENLLGVPSKASILNDELKVDYKIFTAQVAFLWHIKLASDFLTLDVGPMLQYNSELELENKDLKPVLLEGFNELTANDITDINNFNFNGAIGLTAGISHLKIRAQYMYGIINTLGSINKTQAATIENKQFKGNQSMLALTAMFSF